MEALILYFVLFFPGVYTSAFTVVESIQFSIFRELARTITYSIPALALVLYLSREKKGVNGLLMLKDPPEPLSLKPGKKDFISFGICFPGLIIISFFVSFLAWAFSFFFGFPPPPRIEGPSNLIGYLVLIISCLGTGYLEETYFRYYLLTKLKKSIPNTHVRIAFSTLLFSLCHVYAGPWGFLNAVLAGIFLSAIFVRSKSLHGISFAHAAYNYFVYIMSNFVF